MHVGQRERHPRHSCCGSSMPTWRDGRSVDGDGVSRARAGYKSRSPGVTVCHRRTISTSLPACIVWETTVEFLEADVITRGLQGAAAVALPLKTRPKVARACCQLRGHVFEG